MRYTTDPATFIPPTLQTVQHIARREGLDELSPDELDFVWDLLAKTAGAEVREFDEAEAQADAAVHAMNEAQAFVGRTGGTVDHEEWELIKNFQNDYHRYQHQRYDTLAAADLNELPGYNKPTQAVRLVWLFRAMQRLWVMYLVNVTVVMFIDALAAAIQQISELRRADVELLELFVGGDEPHDEAIMLGLELSVSGIQVSEMLRICRKLSELSEQQGRTVLRPDPNGEERALRDIENLSELGKVTPSAFMLPRPLFLQRAVNGGLNVRESQTRHDHKQLLFMVVDGSSSMLEDGMLGASRAAGIVMNRLEAVIAGEAELHLRFFDANLREQEFHADSPESARELMRIIADPTQYMGWSTVFDTTLAAASVRAEEIVVARNLRDPEIVFVTDGQAPVPALSALGGKKLHTFQVGEEENKELSRLARRSGGMGVYLALDEEAV